MHLKKAARVRLWFFPLTGLLLAFVIIFLNPTYVREFSRTSTYTYFTNVLQGNIGHGYATAFYAGTMDIILEPGDILLGGWTNCAYGRYSHAGIYVGDGQVLEAFADRGITLQPVNHYLRYAFLSVLRVKTDDEVKQSAIAYAKSHMNKIFYPLAFKTGESYWNCTKIIWKAFALEGIDLDPIGDIWIAPEAFKESEWVEILYER